MVGGLDNCGVGVRSPIGVAWVFGSVGVVGVWLLESRGERCARFVLVIDFRKNHAKTVKSQSKRGEVLRHAVGRGMVGMVWGGLRSVVVCWWWL